MAKIKSTKLSKRKRAENEKEDSRKSVMKKSGFAVAEAILLIGISLVLITGIFYPGIKNIIDNSFSNLTNWFAAAVGTIGIV